MKKVIIISTQILLFVYSNNYSQWTKKSVGGISWGVATAMDVSSDGILSLFARTSNLPREINISNDYGTMWHKYNTTNEYDGTCISSADSGRI